MAAALTALLFSGSVFAADATLSIEPELISLLDRAVLKIEFTDTKGEVTELPRIDGLNIEYRGPQTRYNFINGVSSSSVTHTYLITPSKIGDYTVGPVVVSYGGRTEVLSGKLRVIKPQDDQEAQQISQIMFSEISTERTAPYEHEPFTLNLKVYVRDGIQIDGQFSIQGGLPETGMDGELNWKIIGRNREQRDGVIYTVYTLRATAKALTAGIFAFRPEVQLHVVVPRQERRSWGFDDPFFGDFFGRQETRPIVLDCNRLNIEVKPIPMKGRPASFTGGVGILDFEVDIGPDHVEAGEPVTLKMRITGDGNLSKITPPILQDRPEIKLYEATSLETTSPNEILFEQVVIPTSDTLKEIPAISFSYFNTRTSDFRTITRGPFPITVDAGPQQAAQVVSSARENPPAPTEILGHDIAYLKPEPHEWMTADTATAPPSGRLLLLLLVCPALVLGATGAAVARHNTRSRNAALVRRQKAPRAARRNIQLAEQARKAGNEAAFYEAMWNALAEYFGHRLNLAPGQITLNTVLSHLPAETDTVKQLFNTIELRRYGLRSGEGESAEEMKSQLRLLVSTLKKCERMKI